ncbi:hypothetical protein BS17DRAFT_770529 [Gyrodon lividus]|nr:hypothetical protein BS17DRAFT_770529 [Gyrodon lividus]
MMANVVQQGKDGQSKATKGKHSKKVLKMWVAGSIEHEGEDDQRKTEKRITTSQALETHEETKDENNMPVGLTPVIETKKCQQSCSLLTFIPKDSEEEVNDLDTMDAHKTKRCHFIVSLDTKKENDSGLVVHKPSPKKPYKRRTHRKWLCDPRPSANTQLKLQHRGRLKLGHK